MSGLDANILTVLTFESAIADHNYKQVTDILDSKGQYSSDLVNMVSSGLGGTPMCRAASSGNLELAEILKKYGADVNKRSNEDGLTPLMIAVLNNEPKFAKWLVENGADTSLKFNEQTTDDMIKKEAGNCQKKLAEIQEEVNNWESLSSLLPSSKKNTLQPNISAFKKELTR